MTRPCPTGKTVSLAVSALALVACGGEFGAADENRDGDWWGDTASDSGAPDAGGGAWEDAFDEAPMLLTTPTASQNFVFIANTTNGTLAKVAVQGDSILISTVRVGAEPTLVRTTPANDTAVVLNRGNDTVSIVRAGPVGGRDDVDTVDILANANQLVLSPDGEWAFAWYQNAVAEAGDRPGSLSEVSAIRVDAATTDVFQLSVGVNVRGIQFDAAATTAFLVSDDGVSIVDLTRLNDDRFVAPVPVSQTAAVGAEREVLITSDGRRAVVREAGLDAISVVNLADASRRDVSFESVPSDLDLLPGGSRALISLGDDDAVAVLDLDLLAADDLLALRRIEIGAHAAGASEVSPAGDVALVWDRAGGELVPLASLLSLDTADVLTVNLRKGVRGAVFSPGGERLMVTHTRAPGEPVAGEPEAQIIAKSYAFSVLASDGSLSKLVRIASDVDELAFSEDGGHAFALVADEARAARSLWWVDLTTLQTREIGFARLPEHVGVVPGAGLVWVSQVHALGRIAFINIETGTIREITGFELNGFIE